MFSEKDQRLWSQQKRVDRLKRFGMSDNTLIMAMSVKFIDEDSTLGRILRVSKDFNDHLRDVVLK